MWKGNADGHARSTIKCDFTDVEALDNSSDTAFAIEATVHSLDKAGVFCEAFHLTQGRDLRGGPTDTACASVHERIGFRVDRLGVRRV